MAKGTKKKETLTPEEKLRQALVPVEEQPYPVPGNWCWTYIKTGYNVTSSKRIHKSDWKTEGVPFYRTRELVKLSEFGSVNNELFIDCDLYKELKDEYGVPQIGDILVSGVGTIGVPYIVNDTYPFYFKDGNVIWFQNKDLFLPEFIFYLYKSTFMYNQIHNMSAGTTVDTYTIINAMKTKIPLPPLPEQQRIVARIESLFAKLDEVKEKAQAVLDGYEDRKAAILHKAFTGELTAKWREEHNLNLNSWETCLLGEVFKLQAGKNINAKNISAVRNDKNSYPCFGGNGVRGYVPFYNNEGVHPIIGRQGALCGNINLATGEFYATEHAVVVSYIREVDTQWAYYYLNFLNLNQYATATAQPGLAVSNIVKVPIKYVSFAEQKEISRILASLMTKEDNIKNTATSVLDQIDTMKKSILTRAFRGQLGTNDPADEPAVELLKKVL